MKIGLFSLLAVTLTVLKLLNVITLSWWWIIGIFCIPLLVLLVGAICILLVAIFNEFCGRVDKK